ncbi:MAG: hypothetical protein HY329_09035 [Chloroflexi bacterium]|nr:hypothetical protein [Chloroflexota bacterium]
MTASQSASKELQIRVIEEIFPAHHARHGTPHPVCQRVFTFQLPQGTVEVEQTDYGHPGRFNPCHPKRVPPALQPKTAQLVAAASSLAALLD